MSRVNHDNRRSRKLLFAAVRVFNVNLAACQESHVRVHAEIGTGAWLHMGRPAKAGLVDDSLDPAVAGPDNIKLNAIQITMIGAFERSEQWIDVTHSLILNINSSTAIASTAERSILSDSDEMVSKPAPNSRTIVRMMLKETTALVTGASRGIGRAIALRLAYEGAAVAVNYRDRGGDAESVVAQIRRAGGRALAAGADVGDALAVADMVQRIEQEFGPIAVLVNNAGVTRRGDLLEFDYSEMEVMRRTNVDGLVHVTRAVVSGMQKGRYGRIVNITSIAAHGTAMAKTTFYAATKAAVSVLTKRFAMELGPHGITVNAVAPGFVPTDMTFQNRTPEEVAAVIERFSASTMVRRAGTPDDIAHSVAFLVSPESGFITGQILTVDGGRLDYIGHS
jgi:3-oxoacyl-[acyl-carrier protein] reductase